MKHFLLPASVLAGTALVASCKPAPDKISGQADSAPSPTSQAAAPARDAEPRIQDYTYAQKTDFVASMQAKQEELNRGIDELAAKLESSSATVKAEAAPKLAAMREQAANLKVQIAAAQEATEATWNDLKSGAQKLYAAAKSEFAQVRQWASAKIAP